MNRPLCKCGNKCKPNGFSRVTGSPLFNTYCRSCSKTKHGKKERINKTIKKDICELCGFKPINLCQLDLDHIDGNRNNNDSSNHQTLCANCHRLKTFNQKDWTVS
jgi:hypothetical protein